MLFRKSFNAKVVDTLIGEDTLFKGVLHAQKSLQIEGQFEGELFAQGDVFISEKSRVKAQIQAKDILISGEVIGNIQVQQSVYITKTGRVYGNISGLQLTIEEGGLYKGMVSMASLTVQGDSTSGGL